MAGKKYSKRKKNGGKNGEKMAKNDGKNTCKSE